jgi:hypothetical protein
MGDLWAEAELDTECARAARTRWSIEVRDGRHGPGEES